MRGIGSGSKQRQALHPKTWKQQHAGPEFKLSRPAMFDVIKHLCLSGLVYPGPAARYSSIVLAEAVRCSSS